MHQKKLAVAQCGGAKAARIRVNPADPTGRVIKGKNQTRWVHGDNTIMTVGRGQIIFDLQSFGTVNDQGTLHPSLHAARANLDAAGVHRPIRLSLADAGFVSRTSMTAPMEGIPLIAVSRPAGQWRAPSDSPEYQRMIARLSNPAGSKLYSRRMGMIEPVFSHLTQRGGRDLHFRGPGRATELVIMATAHNTGKLIHSRKKPSAAPRRVEQPLKTLTIRKWESPPRGH